MTPEDENAMRRIVREELSAYLASFRRAPTLSLADIARSLGKSPDTIRAKLRELRLYKEFGRYSQDTVNALSAYLNKPRKQFRSFINRKRKVSK